MNVSSITSESVLQFSYFVATICIFMLLINIWFLKELIMKIRKEESKIKILLILLYCGIIMMVSVVLIFLAIQCLLI